MTTESLQPTSGRRLTRRRRWIFAGAALTLALGFCLIVGELAVRCFSTIGPRLFFEGRYQPNYSGVILNLESQRSIAVHINADGFRDDDRPTNNSSDALRIAFVGDSFVASMAVQHNETFPQKTGEQLCHRLGRPVEAMNFGVAGADTADYLQFYRHFARKYRPDLVVVVFFQGNDLRDRFPELGDCSVEHPYAKYFDAKFSGMKDFLGRNSRLYMWYEHNQRIVRDRLRDWGARQAPRIYDRLMGQRFARRWDDYKIFQAPERDANLRRCWDVVTQHLNGLREETRRDGAELLVVSVPRAEQTDDALWKALCEEGNRTDDADWSRWRPDEILAELCAENDSRFFPLLPMLHPADPAKPLYYGREHFNVDGHQRVADLLSQAIAEILTHRMANRPSRSER